MAKSKIIEQKIKKGDVIDINALLKKNGIATGEIGVKALGTGDATIRILGPVTDREAERRRKAGEYYDMEIIIGTCDDCAEELKDERDVHYSEINVKTGITQLCGKCWKKIGSPRDGWRKDEETQGMQERRRIRGVHREK